METQARIWLLANVFYELADPVLLLAEAKRVLRPSGRVAVLDWRKEAVTGDQPGPPLAHRVAVDDVRATLEAAGFSVSQPEAREFPQHYLLIGTLAAEANG